MERLFALTVIYSLSHAIFLIFVAFYANSVKVDARQDSCMGFKFVLKKATKVFLRSNFCTSPCCFGFCILQGSKSREVGNGVSLALTSSNLISLQTVHVTNDRKIVTTWLSLSFTFTIKAMLYVTEKLSVLTLVYDKCRLQTGKLLSTTASLNLLLTLTS